MHQTAHTIQVTDNDFLNNNLLYRAVHANGVYTLVLSGQHKFVEFRSPNYGVVVPKAVLHAYYHFFGAVRNPEWHTEDGYPRSTRSFLDNFGNTVMRIDLPSLRDQPRSVIWLDKTVDLIESME